MIFKNYLNYKIIKIDINYLQTECKIKIKLKRSYLFYFNILIEF